MNIIAVLSNFSELFSIKIFRLLFVIANNENISKQYQNRKAKLLFLIIIIFIAKSISKNYMTNTAKPGKSIKPCKHSCEWDEYAGRKCSRGFMTRNNPTKTYATSVLWPRIAELDTDFPSRARPNPPGRRTQFINVLSAHYPFKDLKHSKERVATCSHMVFHTAVGTNSFVLDSIWLEKPTRKADLFIELIQNKLQPRLWHDMGASKAGEDDTCFFFFS